MDVTGEMLSKIYRTSQGNADPDKRLTKEQVGEMFGLTYGQVGGLIYRYEQTLNNVLPEERPELFEVELAPEPPFNIEGDVMIVGDVHVPCTDYGMAGRVSMIAERCGVRTLIIAGDLFNNDFATRHEKRNLLGHRWKAELEAARILLQEWTMFFDDVYFFAGNHDRWITGKLDGEMSMDDLMRIVSSADNLHVSEWGYMNVSSGGYKWRIGHGSKYSINTLTRASNHAQKFQANYWGQHQHHCAVGWDRYKNYVIVDGPALVDPEKLAYVQMDDSDAAGMSTGFGMLLEGTPHLFANEPYTNWQLWLPEETANIVPFSTNGKTKRSVAA